MESAPLLEVFRVFLSTDNTLVFANAALDCILCLLRHVRGIGDNESQSEEQEQGNIDSAESRRMRLCVESLKYLLSCSDILSSMYRMPACPIFHSAQRIQVSTIPQYVDPIIPNLELTRFDKHLESMQDVIPERSYDVLTPLLDKDAHSVASLQSMDKPSGILRVWYILIEGLASATMICPKRYQPHTLETLFHLLRDTLNVPGPAFGLYCINHLLLPMVQNWLRKTSKIFRGWDNFAPNFKQCCGLTTDLVVDYLTHLQGNVQNVDTVNEDKASARKRARNDSDVIAIANPLVSIITLRLGGRQERCLFTGHHADVETTFTGDGGMRSSAHGEYSSSRLRLHQVSRVASKLKGAFPTRDIKARPRAEVICARSFSRHCDSRPSLIFTRFSAQRPPMHGKCDVRWR